MLELLRVGLNPYFQHMTHPVMGGAMVLKMEGRLRNMMPSPKSLQFIHIFKFHFLTAAKSPDKKGGAAPVSAHCAHFRQYLFMQELNPSQLLYNGP